VKAQILFDKTGRVISVMHMPAKPGGKKQPTACFKPQAGQQAATFEIPPIFRS